MNKLFILLIALQLFLSMPLPAQTKLDVLTTEMPPYTGNEKDNTGFLTIIVKSAFAAQGVKTRISSIPWKRAKLNVAKGNSDVIFPVNYEELLELNLSGVLLYNTPPIVFAKQKNEYFPWNGNLSTLDGKSVSVVRGFSYTNEFSQTQRLKKYLLGNNDQVIRMLLADRVDLAVLDRDIAQHYIRLYDKKNSIELLSPPLVSGTEFYVGFSKPNAHKQAFARGLSKIKNNGIYDSILTTRKIEKVNDYMNEITTSFIGDNGTPKGSLINSKVKKVELEDMTIGFVAYGLNINKYQRLFARALKSEADKHKLKLILKDPQASLETQIVMLEQLIEQDVDAIIVVPAHTTKLFPVLKKAKQAGIPVITANTPIDPLGFDLIRAFTGPNSYQQGKDSALAAIKLLNKQGNIVEIQGSYKHPAAIERASGFIHELTKQKQADPDINIEVVDTIAGKWDPKGGYDAIVRLLRRNESFDAVHVHDDNVATGVIKGLKEANIANVIVISSAGSPPAWAEIKSGHIHHTLKQEANDDATLAFSTAVKVIRHETVDFYNFIETHPITPENVKRFNQP